MPPELDPEHRREGARRALERRRERAEVKARLKAGELSLGEVLALEEDAVRSLRVAELLASLPGVGPITATALLEELGIAPSRRVRGLGARQRERLLERFPDGP